ncbi:MAG: hypothetical protein MHPSP_002236, partial [Paramarteilia canceri]
NLKNIIKLDSHSTSEPLKRTSTLVNQDNEKYIKPPPRTKYGGIRKLSIGHMDIVDEQNNLNNQKKLSKSIYIDESDYLSSYENELDYISTTAISGSSQISSISNQRAYSLKKNNKFPNLNLETIPSEICLMCQKKMEQIHHKDQEILLMKQTNLELEKESDILLQKIVDIGNLIFQKDLEKTKNN